MQRQHPRRLLRRHPFPLAPGLAPPQALDDVIKPGQRRPRTPRKHRPPGRLQSPRDLADRPPLPRRGLRKRKRQKRGAAVPARVVADPVAAPRPPGPRLVHPRRQHPEHEQILARHHIDLMVRHHVRLHHHKESVRAGLRRRNISFQTNQRPPQPRSRLAELPPSARIDIPTVMNALRPDRALEMRDTPRRRRPRARLVQIVQIDHIPRHRPCLQIPPLHISSQPLAPQRLRLRRAHAKPLPHQVHALKAQPRVRGQRPRLRQIGPDRQIRVDPPHPPHTQPQRPRLPTRPRRPPRVEVLDKLRLAGPRLVRPSPHRHADPHRRAPELLPRVDPRVIRTRELQHHPAPHVPPQHRPALPLTHAVGRDEPESTQPRSRLAQAQRRLVPPIRDILDVPRQPVRRVHRPHRLRVRVPQQLTHPLVADERRITDDEIDLRPHPRAPPRPRSLALHQRVPHHDIPRRQRRPRRIPVPPTLQISDPQHQLRDLLRPPLALDPQELRRPNLARPAHPQRPSHLALEAPQQIHRHNQKVPRPTRRIQHPQLAESRKKFATRRSRVRRPLGAQPIDLRRHAPPLRPQRLDDRRLDEPLDVPPRGEVRPQARPLVRPQRLLEQPAEDRRLDRRPVVLRHLRQRPQLLSLQPQPLPVREQLPRERR